MSIVQINPFRPSPCHSATETRSFRFSVKIFGRSDLARAPDKLFQWSLNPLSAALAISKYRSKTSDIKLMCRCVLNTANALSYHFHHLCVETTWLRRTLLLLIKRTSNLTHQLLHTYLYILPLSFSQHIRLPSCALHPRPVPSKPTDIHLPRTATTDNGRSLYSYSTPAHTDTRHPITALNSQASRSIARHQEVFVACLRSYTVEEPNIPVKWEDNPVLISYTLAQQFRG